MKYITTKKECKAKIVGVCEGCGGQLEPIKTINNSGNPTYWVGCKHCCCFRAGVERKYFEIARKMILDNQLVPYSHMNKHEYEDTPERFSYWLDTQTARLSHDISQIDRLLKEYEKYEK